MRIFVIAHEKNMNGASLSLFDILKLLNEKHEITLFVPFEIGEIGRLSESIGIKVIYNKYYRWMYTKCSLKNTFVSKLRWCFFEKKFNKRYSMIMAQYLIENKFDLIYTNTRVIDFGAQLSRLTGIRHVWHIREFGEEDFCLYPLDSYKVHWNTISNYTSTIITNSIAVEKKIRQRIHTPNLIKTIYNGVDKKHIHYKETRLESKKVIFMISGRISIAKGHLDVLRAIEILQKKNILDFEVWIVGSGDIKKLLDKSISPTVLDKVRCFGIVGDIENVRRNADVELMCSKAEAFGRVTVEAMMSSMPVIGTNSGGTPELVIDGVTGFLYNPFDFVGLSQKMQYFVENKNEILLLGQNAYKYASQKFVKEKSVSSVVNVLENK